MIVKFKNWSKNQPRKDIKRPWYFCFQNEFFIDSKMYELSNDERLCVIYLLCEVSRANKDGEAYVSVGHFKTFARLKESVLSRTIGKLLELNVIEEIRTEPVHDPYAIRTRSVQQRRGEERREEEKREVYVDSVDPSALFSLWNEKAKNLPKANKLSAQRRRHAKSRLLENPDLAYWGEVISRMADSKFCNGAGSTGWIADFDFFLKPETHLRVMEGKYDDRGSSNIQKTDYEALLKEDV